MKNQVELIIVLIFGFSFLMYLFPFIFVEAAKLESGVTIKAPSTAEPEMECDPDRRPPCRFLTNTSSTAEPEMECDPDRRPPCRFLTNTSSTAEPEEICDDTIDNDNDGKIDAADEDCAGAPAGPTANPCGLQILSGVPINYGQLNPGQESQLQRVDVKNVGIIPGKIMIKGGNWVSDAAGNPTISGPEITHVNNKPLSSNGWELGTIYAGQFWGLAFVLKVPVSGVSGSFHQEITIDIVC